MLRGIKIRIYPNRAQTEELNRILGSYRFVFNHFLNIKQRAYEEGGQSLGLTELSKIFHGELLKDPDHAWLKEQNTKVMKQSKENNAPGSYIAWSEHIATCGKILSYINTLEVKEVDLEKEAELIANGIMISVQANKYGTNIYNTERNDFNHHHLQMAARKGIELGLKAKGE